MLLPFFGFIFTLTLWGSFSPIPFTGINPHERLRDRLGGAVKTGLAVTGAYGMYNKTSHAWDRYHQRQHHDEFTPLDTANDDKLSEYLDPEEQFDSYLEIAGSLITGIRRRRPSDVKRPRRLRPTRVVSWFDYRYEYDPMASPNSTVKSPLVISDTNYVSYSYHSWPSASARGHFMMVVGTLVVSLVVGSLVVVCLVPFQAYIRESDCLDQVYPGLAVVLDSERLQLTVQKVPSVVEDVFSDVIETSPVRMDGLGDQDIAHHRMVPRTMSLVAPLFSSSMGFPSGVAAVSMAEKSRFTPTHYPPRSPLSPLSPPSPSSPPPAPPPPRQTIKAKTNSLALIGPIKVVPEPFPTRPIINWKEPLPTTTSSSSASAPMTFHSLLNQLIYRLLLTIAASHSTPPTKSSCDTEPEPEPEPSNTIIPAPIPAPQTHALVLRRLENISPFFMGWLAQLLLARLDATTATTTEISQPPSPPEPAPRKKQRMSQRQRRRRWKRDMLAKQDEVVKGIEENGS